MKRKVRIHFNRRSFSEFYDIVKNRGIKSKMICVMDSSVDMLAQNVFGLFQNSSLRLDNNRFESLLGLVIHSMKKILLLCAIICYGFTVHSQTLPEIYVHDFKTDNNSIFQIKLSGIESNYTVTLTNVSDKNKSKTFETILTDYDVFNLQFNLKMRELDIDYEKDKNKNLSLQIFYELYGAAKVFQSSVQRTVAGKILIKDSISLRCGKDSILDILKVKNVEIVIKDGFIEDLKVSAQLNRKLQPRTVNNEKDLKRDSLKRGDLIKFDNYYPIGLSSKSNLRNLRNQKLLGSDPYLWEYIKVGDLLDYDQELDLHTKDYSPANGKYILKPAETSVLYKASESKLFDLVAYTDFFGVDEDNPNGLVQFDLTKRFLINSTRFRIPKTRSINWGAFNDLELKGSLTKIEEYNRRLPVKYNQLDEDKFNKYATSINLLNYQVYSLGVDFNVVTLDFPDWKFQIKALTGFRYGRVAFTDSLMTISMVQVDSVNMQSVLQKTGQLQNFGGNTTSWNCKLRGEVFSDKRVGLMSEAEWQWLELRNSRVKQVYDEFLYLNDPSSNKSKMFFRICYSCAYLVEMSLEIYSCATAFTIYKEIRVKISPNYS